MPDAASVYLFVAAAVLLLIVPGPNMAFVASHALADGRLAGFAAALGIFFSDVLMTAVVSAGIGAMVMSWAPAFEVLRLAGAFYLIWIAWQALKTPAVPQGAQPQLVSLWKIFTRGTLNSLLNPKGLLFFMVFLPQFVTTAGDVTFQLMFFGSLLALIALIFHTVLGMCAGQLKGKLGSGKISRRLGTYGFAAVMAALAARLLFLDRPL
ncbi:Threonine/homoserine/homoserine lactone efflux protein [Pseudomonas sp. NFACC02]|uniref:LysE family translocator n=1 Tax=Pseudomonas TaxID=286 RepID=UPI0007816A6C|nr:MULTISPECIES: LysE family translocator [Pseudomonas]SEQ00483.1 Threonine/homoserine/homoserine lactone efflux protein [Pseudomonas sp. NFACC02]